MSDVWAFGIVAALYTIAFCLFDIRKALGRIEEAIRRVLLICLKYMRHEVSSPQRSGQAGLAGKADRLVVGLPLGIPFSKSLYPV